MSTYNPLPAEVAFANAAAVAKVAGARSPLTVFDASEECIGLLERLDVLVAYKWDDPEAGALTVHLSVAQADVYTIWCALRDGIPGLGGFCY